MQTEIPHEPLQEILANIKNIEELNMYQICTIIYEATYLRYSMKFYEEKAMREKVEQKMIEKVKLVDKLEARIKELEDGDGTQVSEESEAKTESN